MFLISTVDTGLDLQSNTHGIESMLAERAVLWLHAERRDRLIRYRRWVRMCMS